MFQNFSLLVLALAVSLDSFGVGVSYGLRKIKIPIFSIVIITTCSGLSILLSMELGKWISSYTSLAVENQIGAFILIGIGCWSIFNLFNNRETKKVSTFKTEEMKQEKQVLRLNIRILGLVIQILRTPTKADLDASGTITGVEALFLGIALSIDAFGAGIGSALMGYSPIQTAFLVSILSFILVFLGMHVGFLYSEVKWVRKISLLPGIILILLGLSRLR